MGFIDFLVFSSFLFLFINLTYDLSNIYFWKEICNERNIFFIPRLTYSLSLLKYHCKYTALWPSQRTFMLAGYSLPIYWISFEALGYTPSFYGGWGGGVFCGSVLLTTFVIFKIVVYFSLSTLSCLHGSL